MIREMPPHILAGSFCAGAIPAILRVLARRCSCGAGTREVPLTPRGDARPAFPADVARINRIYGERFGVPLIPEGHLALLNKVPDSAPWNIPYGRRPGRIGCFMCPSSDMALIHMIAEEYPDLREDRPRRLSEWQRARGLPPAWVPEGRWRIREEREDDEDSHC